MKDIYGMLRKHRSRLSDVIIKCGNVYKNLSTGRESSQMHDVIPSKHYIYMDDVNADGCFAISDGECLFIYLLWINLEKNGWDIIRTIRVTRRISGFSVEDSGDSHMFSYKTFDVCGQYCPMTGCNADGSSALEVIRFFGAPYPYGDYFNHSFLGTMLLSVYRLKGDFHVMDDAFIGDMDTDRKMSVLHDVSLLLMERFAVSGHTQDSFCIVDYVNGAIAIRFFVCVPSLDVTGAVDNMEFFEYRRMSINGTGALCVRQLQVPILWADERAKSCFRWFPSIGEPLAVLILCNMEHVLECLYKYSSTMWEQFILSSQDHFVERAAHEVYGMTSNTGKLHQMLGIPKPMLSMFPSPDIIKAVKRIFKSCPEYLMNMDEESCSFIMNTFIRNKLYMKGVLIKSACLLVSMYGPRNYRKYIEYLNDLPTSVLVEIPYYYEKLSDMDPDCRKYFKWDIRSESTGDDMLVYIQSLNYLIDGINGAGVTHCTKMFEKRQEEWGMYSFHQNGFANINICDVPEKSDLISFLQEFCDSKGIVFSMGDTGLRV